RRYVVEGAEGAGAERRPHVYEPLQEPGLGADLLPAVAQEVLRVETTPESALEGRGAGGEVERDRDGDGGAKSATGVVAFLPQVLEQDVSAQREADRAQRSTVEPIGQVLDDETQVVRVAGMVEAWEPVG